ncbi:sugar-binding domain-containing protein [Herbiconiux sp.]|uniref:sugar-binding transcriptional regulator n=1 Tax=Herbiconiux sp. TaxID=1871186 RepID=UPI0025BACFD9|nr:sugar-binding domain-containing protein [Herbiconiux sp.]
MPPTLSPGAAILAATVARRFYIDGSTKSEIADELGLSRFKVARLLEQSVREGIVKFEIATPNAFNAELSEVLRKKLGLRRVIVIDVPEEERTAAGIRQAVGRGAAAVLSELVTETDVLGIGWGRTLSAMSQELTELPRSLVVQMGGMVGSVAENSLELVRKISEVGGGQAYPLFVPLVVQDALTKRSLSTQPGVAAALKLFDSITVAAVAVGSWDPPDSQMMASLPLHEREALVGKGVAAEVLATLIKHDGTVLPDLQDRSMATGIEVLRKIPELMLIAGGENKAEAVRAVISAGLGTTLVTDNALAELLRTL